MVWQVQDAKNRLSELFDRARDEGPQIVTSHGRPVVQVVAVGTRLQAREDDQFAQYLLAVPKVDGLELPIRRSRKRPIELGN
jgi:prevent-host-death family protein